MAIIRTNSYCSVGNRWGIASVNKSVKTDNNEIYNFKFIINDDTGITYNGTFEFSSTYYQDRYSSALVTIEQNAFVRISDMKKIIRDYSEITNTEISNIFIRLNNTCLECVKHGINSLSRYILCVRLDGLPPEYISMPHLPFDIGCLPYSPEYYPKPSKTHKKALVMRDIETGEDMVVDATKPCPPCPPPIPPFPPISEDVVMPDTGIIMQDLDTGQIMTKE